tara:strand:+ start:3361 stop:3468 length:108 start_codon:yes stop_codon:yes gene_type:complete
MDDNEEKMAESNVIGETKKRLRNVKSVAIKEKNES